MGEFFKIAKQRAIVVSSLKVALFVGTLLVLINYLDRIIAANLIGLDYFKMALTYTVPYMVSTYASVKTELRNQTN